MASSLEQSEDASDWSLAEDLAEDMEFTRQRLRRDLFQCNRHQVLLERIPVQSTALPHLWDGAMDGGGAISICLEYVLALTGSFATCGFVHGDVSTGNFGSQRHCHQKLVRQSIPVLPEVSELSSVLLMTKSSLNSTGVEVRGESARSPPGMILLRRNK